MERINTVVRLLSPDQSGQLLFERGDRGVTRIRPLHSDFQHLLPQVALTVKNGLQAACPGTALETSLLIG